MYYYGVEVIDMKIRKGRKTYTIVETRLSWQIMYDTVDYTVDYEILKVHCPTFTGLKNCIFESSAF